MGTAAAAAIIIRKEKEMVAAFRARGATDPAHAVTVDSLNLHQGVAFRRLVSHAVLRPVHSGDYYLDEPSWEATTRLRRRLLLAIMAIVLLAFLGTFLATRAQ